MENKNEQSMTWENKMCIAQKDLQAVHTPPTPWLSQAASSKTVLPVAQLQTLKFKFIEAATKNSHLIAILKSSAGLPKVTAQWDTTLTNTKWGIGWNDWGTCSQTKNEPAFGIYKQAV